MISTKVKRVLGRLTSTELYEVSVWATNRARVKARQTPQLRRKDRRQKWLSGKGICDPALTAEAKRLALEMGVSKTAADKIRVVRSMRLVRYLGLCYPRRWINLIQLRADRSPEETRNTLIHEIAHLLPSGSARRWHTDKFYAAISEQIKKEKIQAAMSMFGA